MKTQSTDASRQLLALILALVTIASLTPAEVNAAAWQLEEPVTLADGELVEVYYEPWAMAEIEPTGEDTVLFLDRISFEPCSVLSAQVGESPDLLLAEAAAVTVRYTLHGEEMEEVLQPGMSILLPAETPYEVIAELDAHSGAITASVLRLRLDDASASRTLLLSPASFSWPETSECNEEWATAGDITSVTVSGGAGEGADRLYIGSARWEPSATTRGFIPSGPGSTLNVLVLAGTIRNSGVGVGVAAQAGPGEVISDQYDAYGHAEARRPLHNPSDLPAHTLVFGTAVTGQPILIPAEDVASGG